MNTEKSLLILWIIFGYVFIHAVDSVLFFVINLIYFGTVLVGISFSTLNFIVPTMTILIYLTSVILIMKKIKINSKSNGILLTKFPKSQFLILFFIAITLNPITNKLNGFFAEWANEILNQNTTAFIEFYGWMHTGIGIARWTSLIALGLIYLRKFELKN